MQSTGPRSHLYPWPEVGVGTHLNPNTLMISSPLSTVKTPDYAGRGNINIQILALSGSRLTLVLAITRLQRFQEHVHLAASV